MKQEIAEFKAQKREPAKELYERRGGKVTWPDGLKGKQVKIVKTYKQIQEEKSVNQGKPDFDYGFIMANWKPQPSGNYKTKRDALNAWENFKNTSSGFGSFVYSPEAVNYRLVNIETGEEIEL